MLDDKRTPDKRQTYEQYLETMKAYGFYPMTREQWQGWQVVYHGSYKPSQPKEE